MATTQDPNEPQPSNDSFISVACDLAAETVKGAGELTGAVVSAAGEIQDFAAAKRAAIAELEDRQPARPEPRNEVPEEVLRLSR